MKRRPIVIAFLAGMVFMSFGCPPPLPRPPRPLPGPVPTPTPAIVCVVWDNFQEAIWASSDPPPAPMWSLSLYGAPAPIHLDSTIFIPPSGSSLRFEAVPIAGASSSATLMLAHGASGGMPQNLRVGGITPTELRMQAHIVQGKPLAFDEGAVFYQFKIEAGTTTAFGGPFPVTVLSNSGWASIDVPINDGLWTGLDSLDWSHVDRVAIVAALNFSSPATLNLDDIYFCGPEPTPTPTCGDPNWDNFQEVPWSASSPLPSGTWLFDSSTAAASLTISADSSVFFPPSGKSLRIDIRFTGPNGGLGGQAFISMAKADSGGLPADVRVDCAPPNALIFEARVSTPVTLRAAIRAEGLARPVSYLYSIPVTTAGTWSTWTNAFVLSLRPSLWGSGFSSIDWTRIDRVDITAVGPTFGTFPHPVTVNLDDVHFADFDFR